MLLRINKELLGEAIASIGAHPASLPIFAHKAEILPLKLLEVRTPAANILKQEMLAAGGDAVVPTGCIVNADKYVDVLLLGTLKQYKVLLKKLEQMQYFGLKQVAAELQHAVAAALKPQVLKTTLADGRVLTYDKMCVMGILNITPDSFYEGSRVSALADVVARAGQMLEQGAQVLDIGGESTRPGSDSVDGEEERRRVLPVIEALRREYPEAVLSVDTYGRTRRRQRWQQASILLTTSVPWKQIKICWMW